MKWLQAYNNIWKVTYTHIWRKLLNQPSSNMPRAYAFYSTFKTRRGRKAKKKKENTSTTCEYEKSFGKQILNVLYHWTASVEKVWRSFQSLMLKSISELYLTRSLTHSLTSQFFAHASRRQLFVRGWKKIHHICAEGKVCQFWLFKLMPCNKIAIWCVCVWKE